MAIHIRRRELMFTLAGAAAARPLAARLASGMESIMSASQYSRFTSVRRPAVRRRGGCLAASAVLISALLWPAHSALAQFTQYGNKLVGTGAVGGAQQGVSVALSADGNTAIVGGSGDNTNRGAAWVFARSGGVWTQEGNKLVGLDVAGAARQGISVALSADGNTCMYRKPGPY
jgi:hypothetical protein